MFTRRVTQRCSSGWAMSSSTRAMHESRRGINTDKVVVGASAAACTSLTTIGIFHLIVTPVSLTIGLATIAAATASGALAAVEGGKDEGGSSFGAVCGIFFGAIGGYYAKSSKEPWRK